MLPQDVIDTGEVHKFQAKLQGLMKDAVCDDRKEWETLFSPRHPLHLHPLAKLLNRVATIHSADENSGSDMVVDMDSAQTIATIATDLPPSWWGRSNKE